MRSAVLRPTPGIRVSRTTSPVLHGADEIDRLDARKDRQRQLGADAVHGDQPLEQLVLERRGKAEERNLILTDVGVDAKGDVRVGLASLIERRHRHLHVVANSMDVDDQAIGVLLEQAAAQQGDHKRAQGSGLRAQVGLKAQGSGNYKRLRGLMSIRCFVWLALMCRHFKSAP